ncbi:MAG: UTP--glucose-1-phosphate uridylyltransferase [Planctomycetota bacterium]|jgi:UDP-N-acetylglucosamine/UDP-N-acetylgalactosamine diphosphorylase
MAKKRLEALRKTLSEHGQEHTLRFWPDLAEGARRKLSKELGSMDLDLLDRLVRGEGVFEPDPDVSSIDEPEVVTLPATPEEEEARAAAAGRGLEEMRAGRVAALVVAGGQGTRLGFDGPKGAYPVGPVTDRTLFRLHAEKIIAASRRAGRPIPWYIMTSDANDKATRAFLRKHKHFGLDPEDVFIFTQGMLPAADARGRMFLAEPGRVFTAPNGHGGTLSALADSGALEDMTTRGIEQVYYFQVDNPIVPVPDPVFIGHHVEAGAEMSSKVLRKRSPDEPIGTVVRRGGRPVVIEYSDIPPEVQDAVTPGGDMRYPWGSIAIHVISVGFVRRFIDEGLRLPYHRARKTVPHVDAEGELVTPDWPNGTKFEMFIFDALRFAKASVTMEVAREDEFAPVKNAEGVDSVATSRAAMSGLYARWLESAGVRVEREADGAVAGALEISPLTADSAEALKGNVPPGTEFRDGLAL